MDETKELKKLELNQISLEGYQKGLDGLGILEAELIQKRVAFDTENNNLIGKIKKLKEGLGIEKEQFQILGIEEYKKTGEKQLIGGLGVRVGTSLIYDEGNALEWAKAHKLCLLLDKKEFERIAKNSFINFVERGEKITITFPKEIKFDKSE